MDSVAFHRFLTGFVLDRKLPDHALIVGINGIDGSGKTMLAGNLDLFLQQAGHPVCRVSADGFHHPKQYRYRRGEDSPDAYYLDSINYDALANKALRPVFEARTYPVHCQVKFFDLAQDREDVLFQEVSENTIVLAEGVFLFRPEIRPFLHIKIFVRADFETTMEGVKVRDLNTLGSAEKIQQRYERKYIPGQKLYFDDVQPENLADIIIDNNDFESPQVISPAANLGKAYSSLGKRDSR